MGLIVEKDIEDYLKVQVKARGGLCIKYPASFNSGFPDRIVLLPGGRIAFAEIKKPKGYKFADLQKYWKEKLEGLGFTSVVLKDKDEVDAFMSKMAEGIDLTKSIRSYIEKMDEA